jgi:hypothetical protein
MIKCSVCGTENDSLSVTCARCKGYLQSRKDALNLFETLWGVVESPRSTFRQIVLARHKNYTVILSAVFGIALVYGGVWFRHLGNLVTNRMILGLSGLVLGPPVGVVTVVLIAVAMKFSGRLVGGKAGFWSLHAVAAYASVPIICSLAFVFPVELAVFGLNLFGTNPHPMVINPGAYVTLLGLDALAIGWWSILMVNALIAANGLTKTRAAVAGMLLVMLLSATMLPAIVL